MKNKILTINAGDVVKMKFDSGFSMVESVDYDQKTFLIDAGDDYKYEYDLDEVQEVYRKDFN